MSTAAVFAGFRRLTRSAKFAFGKDKFALAESKKALKQEFFKNRNVTDPNEIAELIKGIDEADEVLRFNIVQGSLNDKGNYCTWNRIVLLLYLLYCFHF